MTEDVTAFVPGHVTGFFSAHPDDDPTKAGSRGAGVTLAEGVEVSVSPAEETDVYLNDSSIDVEAVGRVLDALEADATVVAETDLPLGAGFGVSGAMALGTALAANRALDRRLSENELVTIAHGADVQSGSGLGDVVAQAKGGVPIRLEPGGPQDNLLDGIPARARVEYVSFGEVSTEDVLSGETDQLSKAGQRALSRVVGEPTLQSFMYASRHFARDAGLLTDEVRDAIVDVNDVGGEAAMAMLGDTVFALGTGLTEAGYDPVVTQTHPAGATLR